MHSRMFHTGEDIDYDEVLNLDGIYPQTIDNYRSVVNNRQDASKDIDTQCFLTPMTDGFLNQEAPQIANFAFSTDSAVGTESQKTKISTESSRISPKSFIQSNQIFQGGVSLRSSMKVNNPVFPSTQDKTSQHFEDSAMDPSSDGCFLQSINTRHSATGNFTSQPRFTNETTSPNLSFYSLMQRNIMKGNLEEPSSSNFQLAMETQDNLTPGVVFTPFFDNRSISGDCQSDLHNRNPEIFTQEIPNFSSTAASYRQFEQSHHVDQHDQSQEQNSFNILSQQNRPKNITNAGSIPQSILDLYTQIKGTGLSDWSFVYALSAQACQEFMPMSYNVELKTSLLLSIASIDSKNDIAPIPIIAFGQDSSSANSIMSYMGNFAQRFLAPTDHIVNVSTYSDNVVEVGPVFLAKNGVCYLGDWSALPKKVSDEIKIMIDSGRYFINQTSENIQLGTALWSYWSSTEKNKKDFVNVAMFIKYFGIPIFTGSNESDDIIDFLLTEAKDGKVDVLDDVLNIAEEDMKNYLNIVRKIDVRKTNEAQKLLKLYADIIEKDREGLLSVRSFQVIQQMAESFAKLSLRDELLVCDVVNAISIAEKTFYAITGIARAPILASTQNIEEVDQYMEAFHKWLYSYVAM